MNNYKEIFSYIESDFIRYGKKPHTIRILIVALLATDFCFAYSFWLRFCSRKTIFYPIAKWMHWRLSRKYGLQISPKTQIGYGLYIGHGVGIIINPTTIIGNNCNLSQFTTIGSNEGQAAIIGDNVYIGPSVCIVEKVNIGNNVSIGAGAVVVNDIPDNATAAGVPAAVISYKKPGRFINNRWRNTKLGSVDNEIKLSTLPVQ